MKRGREQFKKYSGLIDLLFSYYSMFPKRILHKKLVNVRKMHGKVGLAKRYCILKNLAKSVGQNVSIQPDVYIFNAENLTIGDNVSVHPMAYIEAYGGVTIGDDVSIAEGATIMSVNHIFDDKSRPIKDQGVKKMPIVVGNNVWIGAKATILGDNVIGDGVIIGAGAVVTKSIENNKIVAGVPAKVIKSRG